MTRQTVAAWTRSALGAAALWGTAALWGAAALSIAGCGTPPGQFVIIQNQVPVPPCLIPSTLGTVYRGEGVLDVHLVSPAAQDGYLLFPVMQNNFPPPSGQSSDPNRIALASYVVDVNVPGDAPDDEITRLFANLQTSHDGGPDPMIRFGTPTSGSIASGGGDTAGSLAVVPAALALAIRDTRVLEAKAFVWIMATVRARGTTLTGSVESDAFHYPIRVCDGCLINDVGSCPLTQAPASAGNACNIAQDVGVDCCHLGTAFVCPASVSSQ